MGERSIDFTSGRFRGHWVHLPVVLLLTLSGCARDIGRGAAKGARSEIDAYLDDPRTQARIDRLVDSSMASVDRAFESRLHPRVDAAWDSLLADGRGFLHEGRGTVRQVELDLAREVEGSLSASVESLLRHNLAVLGAEGRTQSTQLAAELGKTFETDVSPMLSRVLATTVDTLVAHLASGLTRQIGPAAAAAAKATVEGSVKAAGAQAQKTPLWKTLILLGIGIIVALVLAAIAWFWRDRRRSRSALDLITREIDRVGGEELKSRIKYHARDKRLDAWLQGFLNARRPEA